MSSQSASHQIMARRLPGVIRALQDLQKAKNLAQSEAETQKKRVDDYQIRLAAARKSLVQYFEIRNAWHFDQAPIGEGAGALSAKLVAKQTASA